MSGRDYAEPAGEAVAVSDSQLAAAARNALGTWLAWPDAARDGPVAVDNEKAESWLAGLPNALGRSAPTDQSALVAELVEVADRLQAIAKHALPGFNWGASALSNEALQALARQPNPAAVDALIARARQIGTVS